MSATAESLNEKVTPKKEVEIVTMSDGRKVEFAGKRKMLKETLLDDAGHVAIRIDFRNGETRTFDISGSPHSLRFMGHGAEQKYGDETAGVEDVEDMILSIDELHDRLLKGDWSVKREGGGMAGTSVLMRALMELSGKTADQVKAFLSGKTQAEKMALRNSPKVKPLVDKIEAEKAAKGSKVDTEALLAGLES